MIKFMPLFLAACTALNSYSQESAPVKYRDKVFTKVVLKRNMSYSGHIAEGAKKKACMFDLYQPEGDGSGRRPLIIWMHGGGFRFGSKKTRGIPLWSKSFAQRGYVCAAVNYRLSKTNPLSSFPELVKACSDAVEDVQQAIAYFKENHTLYSIDTSRIILAGNSAGAIIALHVVYSNKNEMLKLVNVPAVNEVSVVHHPAGIVAIINFWGALFSTEWLKNARVPIVSVHGEKDRVVPISHKGSPLYGSRAIHIKADSLNIPNSLKIYEHYAHELQRHFNPLFAGRATKRRWLEAGRFASDFVYCTLIDK